MNIDDFIEQYDRLTKTILIDNDIIYELDNDSNPTVYERINHQLDLRRIMMRLITLKPEIKNYTASSTEGVLYGDDIIAKGKDY